MFGVFATFTFYLPEIFSTNMRATGSGFCYNIGRILAAVGPFLVGRIAAGDADNAVNDAMQVLFYVGFVAVVPLLVTPFVIETRGRKLLD